MGKEVQDVASYISVKSKGLDKGVLQQQGINFIVESYDSEEARLVLQGQKTSQGNLTNISEQLYFLCVKLVRGTFNKAFQTVMKLEIQFDDVVYEIKPQDYNPLDFYLAHCNYLAFKAMLQRNQGDTKRAQDILQSRGYTYRGKEQGTNIYTFCINKTHNQHLNVAMP